MTALVLGLVLFLGLHSARIFAEPARQRFIATRGAGAWKGLYTVLSLAGFALIVWGYGQARQQPVVLWPSPVWTRHLAALLTLVSFVFLVAAYVPGNAIKAKLGHPMLLGTKVWAFAHLLANNTLADLLLFGGFLAWSIACYASSRRRDRAQQVVYPAGRAGPTVVTVIVGIVAWAAFAMGAHAWLIGVRPFGGG